MTKPAQRVLKWPKQIGPQFVNKVLPWVEQIWFAKNRYPMPEEFVEHFGLTPQQVMVLNNNKFYQNCLSVRGISLPDRNLTAKQIAAISLITNFSDRRSIPVKLMAIDATPEELNGWYQNPQFQSAVAERTDRVLETSFPEVQDALIKAVQNGNFAAIKFYYEVTGRAQSEQEINLKAALQRVLEVIQIHVRDPETLAAIARELTGQGPAQLKAVK